MTYIDTKGISAVLGKLLSSKTAQEKAFTVETYEKLLAKDFSNVGECYLCKCQEGIAAAPGDTEEEAICNFLNALNKEICKYEHTVEMLKSLKTKTENELRKN